MAPFFRWVVMFALLSLASYIFVSTGCVYAVYVGDITKISFLIYALFVYFTIRTGADTYKICSNHLCDYGRRNDLGWFVADKFLTLGLIGTVIGLIIISDIDDKASKGEIVGNLGSGLGTALYTTASGLICRVFLRVQLYNLESCVKANQD